MSAVLSVTMCRHVVGFAAALTAALAVLAAFAGHFGRGIASAADSAPAAVIATSMAPGNNGWQ